MKIVYFLLILGLIPDLQAQNNQPITILANQVAYDLDGPKTAILKSNQAIISGTTFQLIDVPTNKTVYSGNVCQSEQVTDWNPDVWYSRIDFSAFHQTGNFKLQVTIDGTKYESYEFNVEEQALGKIAIPAIVNFFNKQRANSPEELEADKAILLYGSDKTVDLHGGWCDASGDISKYFSHLAYTNFMSPQQIPMVTWSMINTAERVPELLKQIGVQEFLTNEAIY